MPAHHDPTRLPTRLGRFTPTLLLTLLAFAIMLAAFIGYIHAVKQIEVANENRYQSSLLADELRQSSDDLTHMVRSYVATGDVSYKKYYEEILAIRDGRSPRPENYQGIYWDLVDAHNVRPRPYAAPQALLSTMKQAEFSAAELAKLAQSKANSDALTQLEYAAMAIIEAHPNDARRLQANIMINDAAYHQIKRQIMQPISEFYQLQQARTQRAVREAEQIAELYRIVFILSGSCLLIMIWNMRRKLLGMLRALASNEAYAYGIINTVPECILVVNEQGRVLRTNNMLEHVFGYPQEAVLGHTVQRLIPPQQRSSYRQMRADADAHSHKHTHYAGHALFGLHQDGHEFPVEVCMTRLHTDSGEHLIVAVEDITARIAAQRDMAAGKERLKAAATAGIVGIWDWDISTNKLVWDEVMYKIYGISEQDFGAAYAAWSSAIHPDDKPMVEAEIQAALRGERDYAPEFRVVWPDSSVHFIKAASKTSFDEQGKPVRMIGVNYDITEQHLNEQKLRLAKQQADSANRMKSQFLANMSHEIRTPMNAIIGLSALGLQLHGVPPKLRDYLNKIATSSKALLAIINDILDYSKVEAGRIELDPVEFALEQLLDNVADLFTAHAEEKAVELNFEIDPAIPPFLIGDSLRIGQVLNNLVGNAVKFTQRGEVHISVTLIEQHDNDTQRTVALRFTVRDTGIGISSEQMGRLFTAFSQADGTITRHFGGSGLGLVISKKLVEKMGGELRVESVYGKGSRFSFAITLPASKRTHLDRAPDQLRGMPTSWLEMSTNIHGAQVLLVEDNDINQLVACDLLEQMGLTVSIANNGLEALLILETKTFDIVLMDMQMPVLDGLEACRRIRTQARYAQLPIIAMTAAVMAEDRAASQAAGMNAHLAKPIDPPTLLRTLLKWIPPQHNTCPEATTRSMPSTTQVPHIEGLDCAQALLRLSGNVGLFHTLLHKFLNGVPATMTVINELYAAQNLEAAGKQLHSLRGVLGNIAALQAHRLATDTELAIKQNGPDSNAQLLGLNDMLQRLHHAISAYLDAAEQDHAAPVVATATLDAAILAALRKALQAHDMAALEHFARLRDAFVSTYGDEYTQRLQQAIENLDFAVASALLSESVGTI